MILSKIIKSFSLPSKNIQNPLSLLSISGLKPLSVWVTRELKCKGKVRVKINFKIFRSERSIVFS